MNRREFIETSAAAMMGAILATYSNGMPTAKKRIAMVGTGIRGTIFWGDALNQKFGDMIEFVGLCDINPGRVEYAKERMKAACPTFTDFDKMMREAKPEFESIKVPKYRGGHGGGDIRMHMKMFRNEPAADVYKHAAERAMEQCRY